MNITGNIILITGGGSGIGRGLAQALAAEGNLVIIAGRSQKKLHEVTSTNPAIKSAVLDIDDAESIDSFAKQLVADYPNLNVVIQNAGIMKAENLKDAAATLPVVDATITTNLLGPIRLTAALLPHLLNQSAATIMTVTSGLAHIPLVFTPTYCATKAAIHSWTQSLRWQLKETAIDVIELVPPYVQTTLTGAAQAKDDRAMPLGEFIAEVMTILKTTPTPDEILVERVKMLRFAERTGKFDQTFNGLNNAMAGTRSFE